MDIKEVHGYKYALSITTLAVIFPFLLPRPINYRPLEVTVSMVSNPDPSH